MPTIDIIIRDKTASAVNPPCIVCGNSDYNVKFNFDEEWQEHNNKIGVFAYNRCGEWQSEKVLFEGDTCPVPALHGVRSVWIGVTAGDVRTSTPADVPCRMGATDFSDTTEKPSEDIWGQILDKLDTVGTVQRINTVISYDVDRGDYVSSVDFATLLAAAQQPEKYIVTAARREGGVEREYALKEIKQNADFTFLCFFCSIPQYSGSEMSAPLAKYILISSTEYVSFFETDISVLAETWTTVAETTTTEVTSTIYLTFPACRKVRILIDTLGGVTSGQVQVILNAGQDPYIGEARAAIAKTSFSTSSRYIAGVVQVDADWCIGGMQYGYAAIGARADGAQKDLMQPPASMMWANATAYTTAKKTYKETGITEVCIKGVSLPTDAGFDVGAHIIVEGVAK